MDAALAADMSALPQGYSADNASEIRIIAPKDQSQNRQDSAAIKTVRGGRSYASEPEATPDAGGLRNYIDPDTLTGIESRVGYRVAKRAFDIAFSGAVLVGFSWLYGVVALAVKLDDPSGPVIFRQTRVGKGGREFTMYKFRGMCVDAEERLEELLELNERTGPVFKIADDPRITRVGKVIRKLSLDELPQFANVLKGDMSIVGPRPALPREVQKYSLLQRKRLLAKPGITCYWQTRHDKDSITFDEWVDLDLLYIKQCGPLTDLKLVARTIGFVVTSPFVRRS